MKTHKSDKKNRRQDNPNHYSRQPKERLASIDLETKERLGGQKKNKDREKNLRTEQNAGNPSNFTQQEERWQQKWEEGESTMTDGDELNPNRKQSRAA